MPRTVLQIYAAAVCFVSVGALAIALGIVFYSATAVINPSFTLNPMSVPLYDIPQVAFAPMPADGSRGSGTMGAAVLPQPSDEEVAKRRAAALETAMRNELTTSKQSMLRWSIAAVISGFLFLAHWRILHRDNGRAA